MLFKKGLYKKAAKYYQRIISAFTLKDIFNNVNDEDEKSEEYLKVTEELN